MKVILYIGHQKVGSTALQVFLSQNSHRLMQSGILYPAVEMQGFAHYLAKALGQGDKQAYLPVNIREPHSALAYRMMAEVSPRPVPPQFKMLPAVPQMLHAIQSQIAQIKPHTVVLCSEAFANFGEVDPELIQRLGNTFPDAAFEVYCAFRRPDQYLVAWHGQRLKVGEKLEPLRTIGYRDYAQTIHFDFRKVIESWIQKLPQARFILRSYTDINAAQGSAQDFIEQTGTDWPGDLLPVGRPNRSLPLAAMEIVRRANLELTASLAHRFSQFMMQKTGNLKAAPDEQVEMFAPGDRARLMRDFQPVHDYLSSLAGVPSFFPDFDDIGRVRPIQEREATAAYIAQIDPENMPAPELVAFVSALQAEYRDRYP